MVDHFTKFGWTILMRKKIIILSDFKQWLTSYLKPKLLHTEYGGEFRNKVMENYLKEININHIIGGFIIHSIKEPLKRLVNLFKIFIS